TNSTAQRCARRFYLFAPPPFIAFVALLLTYLTISAVVLPNWERIDAALAADPFLAQMTWRYRVPQVTEISAVMAMGFAVLSAACAGFLYSSMSKRWRRASPTSSFTVRDLGPTVLAGIASLAITIPLQRLAIGQPALLSAVTMLCGAILGSSFCFVVSLTEPLHRSRWILAAVAKTGAGPLGLWLLSRPNARESAVSFAQQQILAASVNPELFGAGFIADNMEKVLIARTLCRIGDADYLTLCVKYARSFPDAALEMAA